MRPEDRAETIRRLRSAEGHLRAVTCMVEANEPCEQVLHQLGAVHAALVEAGARLLACEVEITKKIIQSNACPDERVAELDRLSGLYRIMLKSARYNGK